MNYPVFSQLAGNFPVFRDGFARDCLLQQRVHKLSVPVRNGRRIAFTRAYRIGRDPGLTLPDQNFDRIGTIWGHLPFGVRAERHLPAPFGTLGASDPRVRRLTQNPFSSFSNQTSGRADCRSGPF